MAKMIPGTLMVDMFPDGTVRLVFLADIEGGNEASLTVKDLDTAEVLFMTCGLTPGRAAALRTKVARNKVASMHTSLDEELAAKFQYKRT
jgi:hypothetical protein